MDCQGVVFRGRLDTTMRIRSLICHWVSLDTLSSPCRALIVSVYGHVLARRRRKSYGSGLATKSRVPHVSHSLNSLKGLYRDSIGDYYRGY